MSLFAPKMSNTTVAPPPNNPEAKAEPKALARPAEDRTLVKSKRAGTSALRVDLNSGTTFSGGGGGGSGLNLPRL